MKGIPLPDLTEDFSADPVELFFDLAYVFAYSQIVAFLVHDPTWSGAGKAALLFGLIWLPWSQVTWTANAVSGNNRRVRVLFLIATATSVPLAASVSTAFDAGGPLFAGSVVVIMLIGFGANALALERGGAVLRSANRWNGINAAGMVLLVIGATVDGQARIWCWLGTVGFVLIAMGVAGRGEWIIRTGHMAERHGLIVIVALGEIIVAVGLPVIDALEAGEGIPAKVAAALVGAAVFACLLWWAYFDRVGPALEHRAEQLTQPQDRGRYVRDVYTGAHAGIVAGIILAAAALEEIALHPGDVIPDAFRLMFIAGLGLSTASVAIAIWRAYRVVARERLLAGAAVALILVVTASLQGVVAIMIIDLVILGALVVEHARIER
jgi:low temperature requirement protein LtrA